MNKDRTCAKLDVNRDSINIVGMANKLSEIFKDPCNWINYRLQIRNRDKLYQMARFQNITYIQDYLDVTKAIQATDTFWVKTRPDDCWDKVSPYRNRISRIAASIAIDGLDHAYQPVLRTPQPQYTIAGQADKCIKRLDGKTGLYLLKSCGQIGWREPNVVRPYQELCAQQVEELLGFRRYTDYTVVEKDTAGGVKPYSICKLFTNEDQSLIDFQDQKFGQMNIKQTLQFLKDSGKVEQLQTLKDMLLLDQLILNYDRHTGNIGYLYQPDSFKILELAPIFDNDCGFGATEQIRGLQFEEAYNNIIKTKKPKTGTWEFDEQALAVTQVDMYKKLKQTGHISLDFHGLNKPSKERQDFMEWLVNKRRDTIIKLIEDKYNIHN